MRALPKVSITDIQPVGECMQDISISLIPDICLFYNYRYGAVTNRFSENMTDVGLLNLTGLSVGGGNPLPGLISLI